MAEEEGVTGCDCERVCLGVVGVGVDVVSSGGSRVNFLLSALGDTRGEGVGVALGLGVVDVEGVEGADGVEGVDAVVVVDFVVVGVDGVEAPRRIRVSFVRNTPRLASQTK